MFGVSTEILRNHGLSSYAAETVITWKKVAPLLTEQQRETILGCGDEVIYRAARSKAGYEVVPLRMLHRPGIDIGWRTGSEFGPVVPRQYFKTGEPFAVENPYAEREPEFLIRVMNGFDEQTGTNPKVSGNTPGGTSKGKAIVDAYNVGAGLKPAETTGGSRGSGSPLDTLLQPKAGQIRNPSDHPFATDGEALRIRFEHQRNEMIKNEEQLPYFDCSSNMEKARGIALTVNGDGSGAVLVLQAHFQGVRDYVVPLDFKGARDIVIPCGEVSWSDARWGWRFATKGAQYGMLRRISIGLGKVPPKTTVEISVANIRVLPEIPATPVNPVLTLGAGSMQITGTISSESYVWHKGGGTLGVYDLNWKMISELPVVKKNFTVPRGKLSLCVESKSAGPTPWLECQFFVKDTPMIVEGVTIKSK